MKRDNVENGHENLGPLEAYRVARETALADACLVILALRKRYQEKGAPEAALAAIEACHREVQELLRP